jgi:hypothetical protein
MSRTVIRGAVIALVAALVAVTGNAVGIDTVWPVLLAAAVGLSAASFSTGRIVAFVVGTGVSWLMLALRAALLPDLALSQAAVLVGGVVLLTAMAALSAERAPLWAGLAGYAAFAAYYEPIFAANPTRFLAESTVALVTVLLATAVGFLGAMAAELVTPAPTTRDDVDGYPTSNADRVEGGVA